MGRRATSTTKSGKFMNPTDQARKEARKKELKKNKKQRMAVRAAVLKGKEPSRLLEEMEVIDKMEFDTSDAPRLNEKVLKEKRKKLVETFERVFHMYEKEDPEYAVELKKSEVEYQKRRTKLVEYYEQVKVAERVQLDQIPVPNIPTDLSGLGIPLLSDIPMPAAPLTGILKKKSAYDAAFLVKTKAIPAPPQGPPPALSDSEDEIMDDAPDLRDESDQPVKPRKIRFAAESESESSESSDSEPEFDIDDMVEKIRQEEKMEEAEAQRKMEDEDPDELLRKFLPPPKPAPTALQLKMLKLAGQQIPDEDEQRELELEKQREEERERERQRDAEQEAQRQKEAELREKALVRIEDLQAKHKCEKDARREKRRKEREIRREAAEAEAAAMAAQTAPSAPSGGPPRLPPGPPPGAPPMMFRPPPLRAGPPGAMPRMLPPGPPPGRPPGMPPGPPPGLPPNIRGPMPRLPPGVPPPRLLRPPGHGPPGPPQPPGPGANPNVLSAPAVINKQPTGRHDEPSSAATIEAKPQLKHSIGDVTKLVPVALRIKRAQNIKPGAKSIPQRREEEVSVQTKVTNQINTQQTKDDVYDIFMKEMQGFL